MFTKGLSVFEAQDDPCATVFVAQAEESRFKPRLCHQVCP